MSEPAPSSQSLAALIGQELAGFRLTAKLGEGGMAVVFRGQNILDETIARAIKVVRPELTANVEFVRRFTEEARVLERLQHPNIVRFYGLRRERSLLVMELELMSGESLAARLKRLRGLPVAEGVALMQQAAEGVGAAHRQGVVHRDIKPENLFITEAGVTKVLDFGIARALDDADRVAKLTVAGMTLGTPAYMAPEVCDGAVPTEAADVYALGMTLYEVLAGAHPLLGHGGSGKSTAQMMFAQVSTVIPPLNHVRGDVPAAVADVVSVALSKDPAIRFKDAGQLAQALAGVRALCSAPASVEANATRFEIPQIGARRASSPQLPPGTGRTPPFAIPQIDRMRTTGPTSVTRSEMAPRRGHAGKVVAAILAVVVVVGLAGVVWGLRAGKLDSRPSLATNGSSSGSVAVTASAAPAPAAPAAPAASIELNKWILVPPPAGSPVVLGLPDAAGTLVRGFRHARNILAPSVPFEIQQHEVSWGELDPWLGKNAAAKFPLPTGIPEAADDRKKLPATGMPWDTAHEYCRSVGGALPREEEWEYAARGAKLRAYAWGSEGLDLGRTNAFGGKEAKLKSVMTNDQDQTPDDDAVALYDMMGNAQEWTADLFRTDLNPQTPSEEAWVQEGGMSWRAVRGFPLEEPPPRAMSMVNAAYRTALCASGPCPKGTEERRRFVGFRCVRHAKKGSASP
jgi:serine/threonine-protein kinase